MHTEIITGLEGYDKSPKMSQQDAAAKPGVPQAALCSLLKQQETVMAASDHCKWFPLILKHKILQHWNIITVATFIFCHDDRKVNSRNIVFTLQSNPPHCT